METSPNQNLVDSSDNPDGVVLEHSLPTPHFDEIAIQSAQPAVPLVASKPRRFWPLALVLMVGASIVGGVMGLALSRYEKRSHQSSTPAETVAEGTRVSTESDSDGIVTPVSTGSGSDRVVTPVSTGSGSDRVVKTESQPPSASVAPDGEARAALNGALEEWIAATNARDIQRQMNFYNQTVNAFYLTRNVPREAVRAEKSRVFGRANVIDIKAAAPGIRLSGDGRTATMRFRKKYAIEGGGQDRSGEVVQELRWRRTNDGWKIVSERDLRVIN